MSYVPFPKGTILIPTDQTRHLFIITTQACKNGGTHLLLSVTSIKDGKAYDDACLFRGGEHEFIVKPSFIAYHHAQIKPASTITKCVGAGLYVPKADLADEHFKRVCDGIWISDRSRPWMKSYCEENGLSEPIRC